MKKKVAAVLMALALTVSVCACSKKEDETEKTKKTKKTEDTDDTDETEDPTDETTDETTESTTEETTESTTEETTTESTTEATTTAASGQKDFGGATGVEAVQIDLSNSGFEVEELEPNGSVPIDALNGYAGGFSAAKGNEEGFYYLVYDSEDAVNALDEAGLPLPTAGKTRLSIGDVIWHYDMDDSKNQFQCMILNPTTMQVLFYYGKEERGARCNAYAMELGMLSKMNGWASFNDDPEYPDGEPLTTGSQEVPEVDMKNEKAKALLDALVAEGATVQTLPMEGFDSDGIDGNSVGFMAVGAGKYEEFAMIVYAESDVEELKKAYEQTLQDAKQAGVEFQENGDLKYVVSDMGGICLGVVYDLSTGYIFETYGGTEESIKALAAEAGFDL